MDTQAFKGHLVLLEQVLNPYLGQEGKSFALSRLHIAIVVEHCNFVLIWNLLVLFNELLDVLASLEEIISALHLELVFGTIFPFLALHLKKRSQSFRVNLDIVLELFKSKFPAAFWSRKRWNFDIVVKEYVREQFALIQQS